MAEYETKFSGTKQQYDSGATRDIAVGKGKYVFIPPLPLKRLAAVYERGAAHHGDRNWEQGFPMSRALDSAIRHIYQYIEGLRDEDHLAQAAWNLFAAMHFEEMIERGHLPKELNDLPDYMPIETKDYLLEPENVEISAGKDLTAEELKEKLAQIARYEPVTVTGPLGTQGLTGHAMDPGPTGHTGPMGMVGNAEENGPKANTVWKEFISRHHLTAAEEKDFWHWYCHHLTDKEQKSLARWYSDQEMDSDVLDRGRLLDEFFLWEAHNVRQAYGIVPSYGLMDGYGHDNRKTLFGSIVGTPTPKRDDWDEDYRGWDPKGTRDD